MQVTIDGQLLEVDEPLTILKAAERLGIHVPTMCYLDGYDPFTSCMICSVEVVGTGAKLPACTARITDGLEIATQSESVRNFRRLTLDLLLSDHVGDCEAPCTRGCGVDMNIPEMIREVGQDNMAEAVAVVRTEMAMPSILERLCHAPCETPCRRALHDDAVAIKELSLYATDWDLKQEQLTVPQCAPSTGKSIAIVGAGPSGLSAAYFLALKGHAVTVYEKGARALERLRAMPDQAELPDWVVDGELRLLDALGIQLNHGRELGANLELEELQNSADAVLLTMGQCDAEVVESFGFEVGKKGGLSVNKDTGQTPQAGIFAVGNLVKLDKRVLKSFSTAKAIAVVLDQFVLGKDLTGLPKVYDHTMGKLMEGEIDTFVAGASPIARVEPADHQEKHFTPEEARTEATRCMHCDCREKNNCDLRINSDEYGASQKHFKGPQRATYEHVNQDAGAVYESGKCIKCGLCVHVTAKEGEPLGFAFVGRGFDLKTSISLGGTLAEGLQEVADKVVEACPTGALSNNEKLGR